MQINSEYEFLASMSIVDFELEILHDQKKIAMIFIRLIFLFL